MKAATDRVLDDIILKRLLPIGRWRERFPRLRLDAGQANIDDLIRQSRLYISSYNATTYRNHSL